MSAVQCYRVTAYVNVGEDNFSGYRPRAPIAEVGEYLIASDSALGAARTMWVIGNKEGGEIGYTGPRYPHDVRSLSVGDLLKVVDEAGVQTFLAVASVGWTDVVEPTNPIVELAGSMATSRPAPREEITA